MTIVSGKTDPQPQRRAPRWIVVTLVASLALNVLALGMVAAAAFHLRHQFAFGEVAASGFARFVNRLPETRRAEVQALIEPRRAEVRVLRRAAHEARRKVRQLFVAEPFDAAAFRSAHNAMLAAETRVREQSQGLFPDIAERLSADERRMLASWRERRRQMREGWRERRHNAD